MHLRNVLFVSLSATNEHMFEQFAAQDCSKCINILCATIKPLKPSGNYVYQML